MQFQIPKGTFDILPYGTEEIWRQSALWQYVEEILRNVIAERVLRLPPEHRVDKDIPWKDLAR